MRKSQAGREKASQFGQYYGYSEAIYDGYQRRSQYLALEDGTRLAYDLLLPTKDGVPAQGPLPTLFKYTPYLRAFTIFDADGNLLLEDLYELKWYEKAALRLRHTISDQAISLERSTVTLVVVAMLLTLLLACGINEVSITVPAGAQAGDLVGLGWPALAKLLVAVVVLVPILLLVLAWLIIRWVRRRRASRQPA